MDTKILTEMLNTLHDKIKLLSMIQMTMMDYLTSSDRLVGNQPNELMRNLMVGTLTDDGFRDDFTQYVNKHGDDDTKFNMLEMNELIQEAITRMKEQGIDE